jgi:hypothetical protein
MNSDAASALLRVILDGEGFAMISPGCAIERVEWKLQAPHPVRFGIGQAAAGDVDL